MRFWILFIVWVAFNAQNTYAQRLRKPDFVAVQYAGSIGYLSGGAGYNVFKNKAELSFHYGYVPKSKGGELNILATKLLFNTCTIKISDKFQFDPLNAGIMLSYHLGGNFKSRWPDHRYPDGYYWWKTSLRAHLVTQTALTMQLKNKGLRSLTYYIELNTNDLYLASYLQNYHSLRLIDIIKVGYGIRANF